MNSITQNKRYCPHNLKNKLQSVITYINCKDIDYVCRKYHISKASLMRWHKKYDGTPQSLKNKSHKSLTPHPNSHTETELTWIRNLHRRNPNISVCEMYGAILGILVHCIEYLLD